MTSPTLLHAGFDGLDMAYNVQIGTELHHALSAAKADATLSGRQVPLTFRGVSFLVSSQGARGGYAFALDTGEMGANWWFKEPRGGRDPWGARVSTRSLPLALHGLAAMKEQHDQFLTSIGITFREVDRRLSRLDYAIDLLIPGFDIQPAHFISHARRSKTVDGEFSINLRGDTVNGIRIGKMPNTQIAIYDKRRDVIDKRKAYWWDIWRTNLKGQGGTLDKKSPIWRFEFRAGGIGIEKTIRRKTWESFTKDPALIFRKIAFQTRHTMPNPTLRRTHWRNSPVWETCREQIERIALDRPSHVDVRKIVAELEAANLHTLEDQTTGLVLGLTAAYGLDVSGIPAVLGRVSDAIKRKASNLEAGLDHHIAERNAERRVRFGF